MLLLMSIKDQSIKQYSLFRRFQSDMAIRLLCNPRYKNLSVSDNAKSWQIVSVICGIAKSMLTTLCLKKRPHFYFFNNSVKNELISIIFSVQNCEEI